MTMPAGFDCVSLSVNTGSEDEFGPVTEQFGSAHVSVDDQDVKLTIDNDNYTMHFALSIDSYSTRELAKALLKQADLCDQQAKQAKKGGAA